MSKPVTNPLEELLNRRIGNRMTKVEWAYWVEVTRLFLERYNIELGAGNAYGGHLAILLREAYMLGKDETASDAEADTKLPSEPPTSQQASPKPTRKEGMDAEN